MEILSSQIYKKAFKEAMVKCLECKDKRADGECITDCTQNLNVKIIQLYGLKKSYRECENNRSCQSDVINKFKEVLNQFN